MKDYAKLQNGSDVRGVALPGVPGEEVTLTPEKARTIARAFVRWLGERKGKTPGELTIGVGRDSRLSGPELAARAVEGVLLEGAACRDCAMASTPAMFMSTVLPGFGWDGAVMITASHLPWNCNGLKFFTREGGLESGEIRELLALAETLPDCGRSPREQAERADLMAAYAAHLRGIILGSLEAGEKPLAGLKIAVDAGNGAGGFFARDVLEPLGADVSASIYLEPDGRFPNHVPNPEDKNAQAAIRKAVLDGGCDLGLIFDTDVDRAGAVDRDGRELCRNRLIGLMGVIAAQESPGSAIVTDSVTSAELAEFLTGKLGLVHRRFKRGYKNVINEGLRLNREGTPCLVAMETSGHTAMRENYFLDDGAYAAVKIVIQGAKLRREGRTLGDLLRDLREPLEAGEYRLKIAGEGFRAYGQEVLAGLEKYARGKAGWEVAADNCEGVRVSVPGEQGWFLLRMSLHDPLMPLNVESGKAGGIAAIAGELREFLAGWDRLDLAALPKG